MLLGEPSGPPTYSAMICGWTRRFTQQHVIRLLLSHIFPHIHVGTTLVAFVAMQSYGILWNPTKSCETPWNPMKSYGISWNPAKSYGILWNPVESCGILWNPTKSCGILWNPMKSYEFRRIPQYFSRRCKNCDVRGIAYLTNFLGNCVFVDFIGEPTHTMI